MSWPSRIRSCTNKESSSFAARHLSSSLRAGMKDAMKQALPEARLSMIPMVRPHPQRQTATYPFSGHLAGLLNQSNATLGHMSGSAQPRMRS